MENKDISDIFSRKKDSKVKQTKMLRERASETEKIIIINVEVEICFSNLFVCL